MTTTRVIATLLSVAFIPPRSFAQDSTALTRVTAALDRIPAHLVGGNPEEVEDSLTAILSILYREPARATQLLVARLEPTSRGKHRDHPAVVWYIRALRSLTGLDFRARTAALLGDSEAWYIQRDSAGAVHFFGWHMAWDDTWLAPPDAQVAIIRQWQDWYVRNGRGFKYVNDSVHDHWYY